MSNVSYLRWGLDFLIAVGAKWQFCADTPTASAVFKWVAQMGFILTFFFTKGKHSLQAVSLGFFHNYVQLKIWLGCCLRMLTETFFLVLKPEFICIWLIPDVSRQSEEAGLTLELDLKSDQSVSFTKDALSISAVYAV